MKSQPFSKDKQWRENSTAKHIEQMHDLSSLNFCCIKKTQTESIKTVTECRVIQEKQVNNNGGMVMFSSWQITFVSKFTSTNRKNKDLKESHGHSDQAVKQDRLLFTRFTNNQMPLQLTDSINYVINSWSFLSDQNVTLLSGALLTMILKNAISYWITEIVMVPTSLLSDSSFYISTTF